MQYLLILGAQRCGKTVLGRALDMHPNISIVKEPYFFYFKMCRNILYRDIIKKQGFDPNSPMDTNFCKLREEKTQLQKQFSEIYFSKPDIEELKKLTEAQQNAVGEDGERGPKIIPLLPKLRPDNATGIFKQLMEILYEAYRKPNLKYLGLTEGWSDEFIDVLLDLKQFDIKVIQCLRDIRAVVASRNKGEKLRQRGYSGKYPLLLMIRSWRKAVAYSLVNQDNPAYDTVQYETFMKAPEQTMNRLCDFLGVNIVTDMLTPSKFIRGDGRPWKQNSNWKRSNPNDGFSTSSIYKWKTALTRQEAGVIEYLCRPELEHLGLEIMYPDFSVGDLCMFKEDKDQIEEWLHPYYPRFDNGQILKELIRKYLIENMGGKKPEDLIDFFAIEKKAYQTLSEYFNNRSS